MNRNLLILFFTLIVVMMGFGMIIPIIPFYIESFGASGTALGLFMSEYAFMQFIFSPIWGKLSDRIGRKPLLLIGVTGNALSMLLMGLSTSLPMLFIARGLAGILSSATLPTAYSFVTDSTTEENRGAGMGMVGGAMGIGMVIGPGLGGILGKNALSTPFFVASGLSLVALLLIYFILPESLKQENRVIGGGRITGPNIKDLAGALSGPFGILLVISFLLSFGLTNFESVFSLYTLEKFGYDSQRVGFVLMAIGVISAAMQMGATGPLIRRFGDKKVIAGTLLVSALGFILMTRATTSLTLLITTSLFTAGNAMINPAVSSLISKRAGATSRGIALGLNNSFMSLGRIAGPVWAGFIFDYNIEAPYISGAVFMLLGLIVAMSGIREPATGLVEATGPAA